MRQSQIQRRVAARECWASDGVQQRGESRKSSTLRVSSSSSHNKRNDRPAMNSSARAISAGTSVGLGCWSGALSAPSLCANSIVMSFKCSTERLADQLAMRACSKKDGQSWTRCLCAGSTGTAEYQQGATAVKARREETLAPHALSVDRARELGRSRHGDWARRGVVCVER